MQINEYTQYPSFITHSFCLITYRKLAGPSAGNASSASCSCHGTCSVARYRLSFGSFGLWRMAPQVLSPTAFHHADPPSYNDSFAPWLASRRSGCWWTSNRWCHLSQWVHRPSIDCRRSNVSSISIWSPTGISSCVFDIRFESWALTFWTAIS